jgi:hypothetical protein
MKTGTVQALAIRPPNAKPWMALDCVHALAGQGLEGDKHADPLSPRQVLLAGAGVVEDLSLPPHALGENLLIDLDTAQLRSGAVLRVGAQVLLRLMFQCEPCGTLDRFQPGLSGRIGNRRGILARVLLGGAIHPGDSIVDIGCPLPAWPDDWRARVAQVLQAVPEGMVLSYAQLALLAGVQSTYCRAFPRLLAKLGPGCAGKALPAQAVLGRRCWDGGGLFDDM